MVSWDKKSSADGPSQHLTNHSGVAGRADWAKTDWPVKSIHYTRRSVAQWARRGALLLARRTCHQWWWVRVQIPSGTFMNAVLGLKESVRDVAVQSWAL